MKEEEAAAAAAGVVSSSPSSPCGGAGALRGRYVLGRVLGRGAFAKVHRARDLRSGRALAIKVIHKDKILQYGMAEQLVREISAMKALRHPNVLELYEVMATRSKIYLAMELARGGDLFSRIAAAAGGRLREDAARHFFRQLVSAVAFCHSQGVCHRDLKPENLLLLDDCAGSGAGGPCWPTLKVADFGLSAPLADRLLRTACGTPAYAAPEVLRKRGYDGRKADAWSCGVVLYVLLAGFLPFLDDNIIRMHKKMLRGDFRCPPWLSADARTVLTGLLDPDPNSRTTIAKLAETPWLKKCPVPRGLSQKRKEVEEDQQVEPATMNAFHLIALSEGFDLSPLFVETGGDQEEEAARAAARKERARGVVSTLESVARARATIAAAAVAAAAAVEVSQVTLFCRDELRPAAKFVMWPESETQVSAA